VQLGAHFLLLNAATAIELCTRIKRVAAPQQAKRCCSLQLLRIAAKTPGKRYKFT
jgi:hypothetical protein